MGLWENSQGILPNYGTEVVTAMGEDHQDYGLIKKKHCNMNARNEVNGANDTSLDVC